MVASHDWYFLPLVNPDGYEYSRLTDRMWRKTRVPNEGSTCVGADANRNFDHNFAGPGTSSNPCSETFHGMSAYSQPCAGVVASFVEENTQDPYRHIFMTLHSYSQLWMAPWGYTYDRPANYDELMRVGNAAAAALQAVHGTVFEVGSASEILYLSSGTSRDWAYGVPGFEFVYTLELRDTGNYGFLLPPEQILPSGEETWAALTAMYDAIMNP
jgi:murein tripeptide amidase MpaA